MSPAADIDLKIRFLRALAFEIHRKRPPEEAMLDCIDNEGRAGRHKGFRQAREVLEREGLVAALVAAGLVSEEVSIMMSAVVEGGDHRLLAGALNRLADYHEASS